MARILLTGDAEAREEKYRRTVRARGLKRLSRFESTKPPELRFRALLSEGDARVLFHHEAV
jgi:hypothetical protein